MQLLQLQHGPTAVPTSAWVLQGRGCRQRTCGIQGPGTAGTPAKGWGEPGLQSPGTHRKAFTHVLLQWLAVHTKVHVHTCTHTRMFTHTQNPTAVGASSTCRHRCHSQMCLCTPPSLLLLHVCTYTHHPLSPPQPPPNTHPPTVQPARGHTYPQPAGCRG